jgi:hypothetical protein
VFGLAFTPPAVASLVASTLSVGVLAPARGVATTVGFAAAKALHEHALARDERAESGWSYALDP